MTVQGDSSSTTVRAVDRALDILLCISRADDGRSLSDVAREVGLHKSTVHRLLTSMQQKGFIRKQPRTERYVLGWSVLELLSHIYQSDELKTVVLPEMTRLRDLTGETVSLYIRSGIERIRIQSVESNQPIRNVAEIGKVYPLYIGASGKVLLAYAEDDILSQVCADAALPVDFDMPGFREQLERVRGSGYAISVKERDTGAAALAVPVFGQGDFVAALSISGPAARFTHRTMAKHIQEVKDAAALITRLLSH